jgi:hypothetical protein
MKQLQLPANGHAPDESIELTSTSPSGDTIPARPHRVTPTDEPCTEAGRLETFEDVLSSSRVYDRVKHREVDAKSTTSTSRSRAWSILSGLSLTQISVISVIKLPLYDTELRRFHSLVSSSALGMATVPRYLPGPGYFKVRDVRWLLEYGIIPSKNWRGGTPDGRCRTRIMKELSHLGCDPTSYVAAGPIGDDLVCTRTPYQVSSATNKDQSVWQGTIFGPVGLLHFQKARIVLN